jgi:hypothetical protein
MDYRKLARPGLYNKVVDEGWMREREMFFI